MDKQQVDMYIMANSKYFDAHHLNSIRSALLDADDSRFMRVQTVSLKDPTMSLIVSLVAGYLGVDRFIIGDVGLGIAKLLTCGGLGIWTIVDYFLIMGRTREVNFEKLEEALFF